MKRLILILGVVALAAVAGLVLLGRRDTVDLTLGGPLFATDPDRIEGVLVTRGGLQYRFDRLPGGTWTLGGAIGDYVDQTAMDALVADLVAARAGAILPGTEREDRRYEFNGPDAIRVRLYLGGGEDLGLAIGTVNPVTGNYYASGAGRDRCFPVAGAVRDRLNTLPVSVQARTLLPAFARADVEEIDLVRGEATHRFARADGAWWLRLDAARRSTSLAAMTPVVQAYQAAYADRTRHADGAVWIMADGDLLERLMSEVGETIVRDILPPRDAARRLEAWQLDPPWRVVTLRGEGLNPDPGAPVRDEFTLVFGPPVEIDRVPVLRRGNVLLTDEVASKVATGALSDLVLDDAVTEVVRHADRLRFFREGQLLLAAARTGAALTGEGRRAWRLTASAPGTPPARDDLEGVAQDLVIDLNRQPILAVLPPTDDAAVLATAGRVRVEVEWDDGRSRAWEVGQLVPARLPAGAAPVRTSDGAPAAALWEPATGRLLQVPATLIVTARNLALEVRAPDSP